MYNGIKQWLAHEKYIHPTVKRTHTYAYTYMFIQLVKSFILFSFYLGIQTYTLISVFFLSTSSTPPLIGRVNACAYHCLFVRQSRVACAFMRNQCEKNLLNRFERPEKEDEKKTVCILTAKIAQITCKCESRIGSMIKIHGSTILSEYVRLTKLKL